MDIQAELDRFEADTEYLDRHRHELLARFPDRWVAAYNQTIVGAAESMEQLVELLKSRGVPPEHSYCEYLSTEPLTLILDVDAP